MYFLELSDWETISSLCHKIHGDVWVSRPPVRHGPRSLGMKYHQCLQAIVAQRSSLLPLQCPSTQSYVFVGYYKRSQSYGRSRIKNAPGLYLPACNHPYWWVLLSWYCWLERVELRGVADILLVTPATIPEELGHPFAWYFTCSVTRQEMVIKSSTTQTEEGVSSFLML